MPRQTATIIKEGRRGTGKQEALKESEDEKRARNNKEKRIREERKNQRAIKKLKKEGKVQPISAFLEVKDEPDDPWMSSKLKKVKRGRVPPRSTIADEPIQSDITCTPSKMEPDDDENLCTESNDHDSDVSFYDGALSSDDNDDYIEDILNFRPFRHSFKRQVERFSKSRSANSKI